ncbi:type II secretion system F family protein [Microbacterium sp. 4R-513]|uniref:type II secretion system F family protein n=1 Tax=Microbacterium sp. 4R-513 TaxID=2567934 RepID=UPI0013E13539|nr:type II secretion system F family protein [Microbacterium sp. 4R-513]QIG39956.1 type II secretion system F family protein [Microbacterium sp. 4R-513]
MKVLRARATAATAADVATTVLRLAVLLQAGLAPARAWALTAESGDPVAVRVRAALEAGEKLPDAIVRQGGAWTSVGAAWTIATTVGAPLADTLRGIASALRDAQETADDVRVTLAEPAGTARLMAWLPLVAIALGAALGFDTFATLVTNPLGIACLAAGAFLIVVAHRWTAVLVRRAQPDPGIPGLDAELLAIALSGGASIERARVVVASTGAGEPDAGVDDVLHLSQRAGVPAVELLKATAALARHRARVEGRLRAARLSSRLLLPLGVCTLPAFLLLGVAPMLLSVMSTMSISL